MYKNNFYQLLIAFLILIGSSHVQAVVQNDKTKWKHLNKKLLDNTTITALERWHTDSVGCLNLRKWDDGQLLIERFKLEVAKKDSVIKVLGQPNYVVTGETITTWTYFIHTWCQDGTIGESEKSLSLTISLKTNKVIEVSLAIH